MRIKFGALVTEGSGRLGGQVVQGMASGSVLRSRSIKSYQPTLLQVSERQKFYTVTKYWKHLTEAQRTAWESAKIYPQSGFERFTSINIQRLVNGMALSSWPTSIIAPPYSNSIGTVWAPNYSYSTALLWNSISYDHNSVIIASTNKADRLLRSANNGVSWSEVTPFSTGDSVGSVCWVSGSTWLCITDITGDVYRSLDNGLTWSFLSNTIGSSVITCMRLIAPAIILAGDGNSPDYYRSSDSGLSFTLITNPYLTDSVDDFFVTNTGRVFALSSTNSSSIYSDDLALTWHNHVISSVNMATYSMSELLNGSIISPITFNKNYALSSDNGSNFVKRQFTTISVLGFRCYAVEDNIMFICTPSNSNIYRSSDSGLTFTRLIPSIASSSGGFFLFTSNYKLLFFSSNAALISISTN